MPDQDKQRRISIVDVKNIRLIPKIIEALGELKRIRSVKGDSIKGDKGESIKGDIGESGEHGYTPVKGEDYFTPEEALAFLKAATPKKGKDYFDGKTPDTDEIIDTVLSLMPLPEKGEDGIGVDENEIIEKVLSKVPTPKDGLDGISGATGATGKSGKDAKPPTKVELKKLVKPIVELFTGKHEEEHDHNLLHSTNQIGSKILDETRVKKGRFLMYNGQNIIYEDIDPTVIQTRSPIVNTLGKTAAIETITASDTLDGENYTVLCDCTAGDITVTLPPADVNQGRIYYIKKIDSSVNTVIIDPNASEQIDDGTTAVISNQYEALTIQCNQEWYIL